MLTRPDIPSDMGEKAPAFQFYARDFIMSCHGMTDEQVGAYTRLLCFAWDRDGLPCSEAEIQQLGYWSEEAWSRIWPVVGQKWKRRGGRFVNERQERERAAQKARREAAARAGKLGGQTRAAQRDSKQPLSDRLTNAIATEPLESNTASALALAKDQKQERSATTETPIINRPKIVLTFPTDGDPGAWTLLDTQVAEWQAHYPGLDVMEQCRSAFVWATANPTKRKTAAGMPRFLVNWFNRSKTAPIPFPSPSTPQQLPSEKTAEEMTAEHRKRYPNVRDLIAAGKL